MRLECVLKRASGTQIELDSKAYDFQPNDEGHHVALVTEQAHIDRLLSDAMNGAFRVYGVAGNAQYRAKLAREAAVAAKAEAEVKIAEAAEAEAAATKAMRDADAEDLAIADAAQAEEAEEAEKAKRQQAQRDRTRLARDKGERAKELLVLMRENPDWNEDDAEKALKAQEAADAKAVKDAQSAKLAKPVANKSTTKATA